MSNSESTTVTATPGEPGEAVKVDVTPGDPAGGDSLGEGGKKALDAERKARTAAERQAADLKAKLDLIEAANLSDLEKAQKAAQEAQEDAAKARTDALRFRIAAEFGITEHVDLILTASDEETMRKQAEIRNAERQEASASRTPKPDLSQGAQNAPALNSDALTEALARAVGR